MNLFNPDDEPLTFGKYKGKTPNEVAGIDPSYLVWLVQNVDDGLVSDELYSECFDTTLDRRDYDDYDEYFDDEDRQ